jgi:hypothetical protein
MGENEYVLTHTWFSRGKIQYILIFPGGGGNEYVTPALFFLCENDITEGSYQCHIFISMTNYLINLFSP